MRHDHVVGRPCAKTDVDTALPPCALCPTANEGGRPNLPTDTATWRKSAGRRPSSVD